MKKIIVVLFMLLFFSFTVYGSYRDTGYITWKQPNGITFTARNWGDEFFNWMETKDGYRIVGGEGNWYYYAVLNNLGDFRPSKAKVGIDPPLKVSYKLKRADARISEIEAEIEEFNSSIQSKLDLIMEGNKSAGTTGTKSLAVVLVDFTPNLRGNYDKTDFDSLFFSTNWYKTYEQTNLPLSPSGEKIYGSFRDYYLNQSINQLDIIGTGSNN